MGNQSELEAILKIEGADEALQLLSSAFTISNPDEMKENWPAVEDMLLNFKLKRYRITQDFLFSETTIHPFKNTGELEDLKSYLLN